MDYTADTNLAWHVALRAYRGGDGTQAGVIKDHIYLRGMNRVAGRIVKSDRPEQTLRLLYIGKYSVDDVSTVEQLYHMDVLTGPAYTPFALLEKAELLSMAERIADQEISTLVRSAT
jgi:hypothetical protein